MEHIPIKTIFIIKALTVHYPNHLLKKTSSLKHVQSTWVWNYKNQSFA